jgi:lauroyl/myristoyl acyltransferase
MFVAPAAAALVLSLKLAVAWTGFHFLRGCERLLPPSVLSLLLWPPAAAWDLVELRRRKLVTCWRRFPESWRPKRWRFVLRQSLGLYHSQLIYTWPDRLCAARWLGRCRLEGGSDLIGSREGERGVVLASLHFGPSEILPYWLRAHGIVTTLIGASPAPDSLESLTSYQYAFSPPADVPMFLPASEMSPLPRSAHVRQFLGPGRRLLVMVDVDRGIQFHVSFENRLFRMATGAIRLAAMADAELIPCLIAETATWKFAIHFGTPVPRSYLGNSPDMQAVGTHLLREFSKVVTRYPGQCNSSLLSALSPLPVNVVSGLSAVAPATESH